MNCTGRKRDPIWQYFDTSIIDGKVYATYKSCGNQQLTRVERLKKHFEKYHETNVTEGAHKKAKLDEFLITEEEPGSSTSDTPCTGTCTHADIDHQIAKMFYSCNISFNFASNTQYLKS